MDITWKIGAGVAIGVIVGFLTYDAIQQERAKAAINQAAKQMHAQLQAIQQANAEQTRQYQERARRKAEAESANAALQASQSANMQRARNEQILAQQAAQEAKAEAWKRFFKPTESCIRDSAQMECANAHIVAKRAFEAQYQPKE